MSVNDLAKLVALALFAAVIYAAGFLCGMAREEAVWERAAVQSHAAIWEKNRYTGQWTFHWTPAPRTESQ